MSVFYNKRDKRTEPVMAALTRDEVRRLIVCIDNLRDNLLIQLGLITGSRVSEITNIPIRNIRPDCIRLWDEKKDCHREVVIDAETRKLLNTYLAEHWKARPHRRHMLFYFGPKTANRILKKWGNVAEIPSEKLHWHSLRHTYITLSLDRKIPISHICAQTGDSANTVIRVYGQPGIDSRLREIERRYWE